MGRGGGDYLGDKQLNDPFNWLILCFSIFCSTLQLL